MHTDVSRLFREILYICPSSPAGVHCFISGHVFTCKVSKQTSRIPTLIHKTKKFLLAGWTWGCQDHHDDNGAFG